MARKTKEIKIDSGRDAGKKFIITEKSAMETERFLTKLLLAIGRKRDIGTAFANQASLAVFNNIDYIMSLIFSLDDSDAEALLDEMLTCVKFKFDINRQSNTRTLDKSDIEDISTLFTLRKEVVALHGNFTFPESA